MVALNKADAVPGGPAAAQALAQRVEELLSERLSLAGGTRVQLLSARQGDGMDALLAAALEVHDRWNSR